MGKLAATIFLIGHTVLMCSSKTSLGGAVLSFDILLVEKLKN